MVTQHAVYQAGGRHNRLAYGDITQRALVGQKLFNRNAPCCLRYWCYTGVKVLVVH